MKKKTTILEDVLNYFAQLQLHFNFKNLGYLPRWVVLLLDSSIVLFSGLVTFILLSGIRFHYIETEIIFIALPLYLGVNIFYFWIFRTYSGIIRHSSYIDALKLFFSQFACIRFITIVFVHLAMLIFHYKVFVSIFMRQAKK